MENITSGYLVINNIRSTSELTFLLLTILTSAFFLYVFKNNFLPQSGKIDSKLTSEDILVYVIAFYLLNLLLSVEITDASSRLIFSLATILVLMCEPSFKVRINNYFQNDLLKVIIIFLSVNLKFYVLNASVQSYLIVNLLFFSVYRFYGIKILAAAALVLLFRDWGFGLYVIHDPFHQSEHFVSALAGLVEGKFKIFPNIGYWEELVPSLLIQFFTISGLEFSLSDARALISILCVISLFLIVQNVNLFLAIVVSILIQTDRLGLLFVMVASVVYATSNKNFHKYSILSLSPLLFIGVSPSYWSIFLMAVAIDFVKNGFNWKSLLYIVPIWFVGFFIFQVLVIDYLVMYKSWSEVNSAGHGLPLLNSSRKVNVERLLFLSVLFVYIYDVIKGGVRVLAFYAGLLLMCVSLYIYFSYAFGRIDNVFSSRFVPIGLCLLVLCSIALSLQRNLLLCVSLGLIAINSQAYNGFSAGFERHKLLESRGAMRLEHKYEAALEVLKRKISPKEEVIFFNDQPALVHFVAGAVLPPVTSPWVAIGVVAQEKIIKFLKANDDKKIFLGETLHTFDGVDVRARSPLVYKFISDNYFIDNQEGLLFATPKNVKQEMMPVKNEIPLFSGFDIGKSSAYYERKLNSENSTEVIVNCEKPGFVKVKMTNEKNWFYADLKCGKNRVANIYFDGWLQNVEVR